MTGRVWTPGDPDRSDPKARRRVRLLATGLVAGFVLVALGHARLAVFAEADRPAEARAERERTLPVRADLVDRNGELLARSLRFYTLFLDVRATRDAAESLRRIASVVPDVDTAAAMRRFSQRRLGQVIVHADVSPRQRAAILAAGAEGVVFEESTRRVYPRGTLAAHVIGFVNREGRGVIGAERAFDAELRAAGSMARIALSIDVRVQYAVEEELERAARGSSALGGAAIVVEAASGEVLALASWPTHDLNAINRASDDQKLNRALTQRFEMGSTVKVFTFAEAIEAGRVGEDALIEVHPLQVAGSTIRDFNPVEGPLELARALAVSSNTAAARLALGAGATRQRTMLRQLGLLDRPLRGFAEAAAPIQPATDRWTPDRVATIGYGHGVSVSAFALAEAFSVFANDGRAVRPGLLARPDGLEPPARQVFSPATTRTLVRMMRETVTDGTGIRADAPGYEVAGKTGTAEKQRADGTYDPDRQVSSFVGLFPARAPRFVVFLMLDEPQRVAANANLSTGGAVAAPAVGRIVTRIAPVLGVTPRRTAADGPIVEGTPG
jgi:cell division protein FtsI (penicillin-binding protein 3)